MQNRCFSMTASATLLVLLALGAGGCVPSVGQSKKAPEATQTDQVSRCSTEVGTAAVMVPKENNWSSLGLQSPKVLVETFAGDTGCFQVVDSGKGFDVKAHRVKKQWVAPDYEIVPVLTSVRGDAVKRIKDQNDPTLGSSAGSATSNVAIGAALSLFDVSSNTADVTLRLLDGRTNEQVTTVDGHAEKTGTSIGYGLFVIGKGVKVGSEPGLATYQKTEIGQVVALAYRDAFKKLEQQLTSGHHKVSE